MPQSTEQITSGMILRRKSLVTSPLVRLGALLVLLSLLGGSIWAYLQAQTNTRIIATNGSDRWATDHQQTAVTIPFPAPETLQLAVDPAFVSYYHAHDGARLLGAPLTPGFAVAQGWMQYFTYDALLQPGIHRATSTGQPDQQLDRLMQDGLRDRQTGITRLPLLQALLTVGSLATVGGGLRYVDLRSATNPDQMIPDSTAQPTAQGVFIAGGTLNGKQVGHIIPAAMWAYITRHDVSPDGWQTDFGAPLTEAIPYVNVEYGVSHRMLLQVFARGVLTMDRDLQDASGQPLFQMLNTGVAYLQTLTPPAALGMRGSIWTNSALDILNAPATGNPVLHVAQSFPLTLTGKTQWSAGMLWYQVRWKNTQSAGTGWAPANDLTFSAPAKPSSTASKPAESAVGNGATLASFDQLSPGLAQYLKSQSSTTGAAVYDLTTQKYYAYQPNNQYLMGDSIKLPFLLAFLSMTEQQGRHPTSDEMSILKTMMSTTDVDPEDDDADADMLYNEIGRALGLKEYLNGLGITGLTPENDDWTYSLTQPQAMVQLLTMLYQGKILTPEDRALALSLLQLHTTPNQQIGVGDTRPQGAAVTLQDGWVMGTDALWAMNSAGIVTVGGETYVIAVYSSHLNTLDQGRDIARQVCGRVAALLG
jgi:beta-lactamase class A